jgi:AhpD family alkylhydroperoxidase
MSSTTGELKMLNWEEYRGQLGGRIEELNSMSPETLKGFRTLGAAASKTNLLGTKMHELISLAVAVTTRCDGCIGSHAAAAKKAGATKEEVAEALSVAISMNAGAAMVFTARTLDAFDKA